MDILVPKFSGSARELQEGIGRMPAGPAQRMAENKLSDFIESVCSPFARPRELLDKFLQICQRGRDKEQVMKLGTEMASSKHQTLTRERKFEAYSAEHVRESMNNVNRLPVSCFRYLETGSCPYAKTKNGKESCRFGVHSRDGTEYKNLLSNPEMMEKFTAYQARLREDQRNKKGKGKERKANSEAAVAAAAKTAQPVSVPSSAAKGADQKPSSSKSEGRSGKPSVVTGTGTRGGTGSEAVVSEVLPSKAGRSFQLMTYPQLYCAETERVNEQGKSTTSVISGVGTTMDSETHAISGLDSSRDVVPILGSESVPSADQLNILRDFRPPANVELFAFVAEDCAPAAACEELFARMPQPADAIKRIFTFMSRVVICEPGHPLHGEEGYVYRFDRGQGYYCIAF